MLFSAGDVVSRRKVPTVDYNMKIQTKIQRIVLLTGLATLAVLSVIMAYSMFVARNMAVQYASGIGQQSMQNSSTLLKEEKQREIMDMAADRAEDIDYRLRDMEKIVRTAAAAMLHIQEHAEDYHPHPFGPPPKEGGGKVITYVQYGPHIKVDALKHDLGIAANIQDTLLALAQAEPVVDSIYVASRDNYTFSADNYTDVAPEDYEPCDLHYDALASDWYRLAVDKGGLVFTPIREFVFSKKLGMFCAVPYVDTTGALQGVACMQTTLASLEMVVEDINLRNQGFCFVVDERGYVILSSHVGTDTTPRPLPVNLYADLRHADNAPLAQTASRMLRGERGISQIVLAEEEYYVAWAPIKTTGWSFGVAILADEVMIPIVRNNENIQQVTEENIQLFNSHMVATMTYMVVLVMLPLGIVWMVARNVSRRFVQPLDVLTEGVRHITKGNLDKKIQVSSGDEMEVLAACFNDMTDSLKKSIENLAQAMRDNERQNVELKERNAVLSVTLRMMERLRTSRDAYRAESEIDQLTQVYNKATAERVCTERCARLQEGMQAVLFIIDLDHFKEANDTFGHQFGDRILQEFALRLKLVCRSDDCVARFGGDEFLIMMVGTLTDTVITTKALAILQATRDMRIDDRPTGVTASIGIAIAPRHGTSYAALFQTADKALYHVKEQGRNGYCLAPTE